MRFKGKKPIFNKKDTWDLTYVLSPVLAEGLKKFKEVISDPDCVAGCPSVFIESADKYNTTDEELEIGIAKYHEALDKMIYAFSDEEPKIPDDAIKIEFEDIEDKEGFSRVNITHPNQKSYDDYLQQEEEHNEKVKEGLELFGKHYNTLWW
jgi:hypothetical protein